MTNDAINNEYFEWLYDIVCHNRYSDRISYRKLLMLLHNIEFIFTLPMDENRANDGEKLRDRFILSNQYGDKEYDYINDRPCSVLEMMVALAIRCEEDIMDDPKIGDRTGQWFWQMVNSLGIGDLYDSRFDKRAASTIIHKFMHHDYEPNGEGGLFTILDCDIDLRGVEIWDQLNWYINMLLGD